MATNEMEFDRKMSRLQRHVNLIEAVAVFLSKHPVIASRCHLYPINGCVGLDFEEKAFIRPMGKNPIRLRLERHRENLQFDDDKTICEDVSGVSTGRLTALLLKTGLDLNNPGTD